MKLLYSLPFLLLSIRALSPELWGTDQCDTVACRFKAPHPNTPSEFVQKWREEDEALWKYVNEQVPAVLDHTGSAAFDEHLKGVQAVLRNWGAPTYLANAGLFHSIYGTEGFQGFSLPLSQRNAVKSLIGDKAEKLAFVFCMLDRSTFDATVFAWTGKEDKNTTTHALRARPELGRFEMELNYAEWLDFLELTLADWLEQVEGAATKENELYKWRTGEAYSYRRTAYKKMSRILAVERPRLSEIVPQMHGKVMATEGENSRNLVQMRTPPQSDAAKAALAALRAAGESIPEDLSPKPSKECMLSAS
mmetsp:Transcript_17586/g.33385  ORF Transcript_17586/g.33385 Transcript_17586/m.33385 type:complete len:306 (-) Transcript_17586:196-1113(-)|eukprot:CAMPEP_0170196682 /NCGR_PEP_ID=MMETSP0040_2-20121228/64527_1 /TAXON_ID=641309 /ORGANISM="Lotharella oceanica, Strain CCMP622" /LENGTH=305 /DNA_ID=CAMNT_0010446173 /DNA_START=94 /DNA_END=1011 /DNA_ORIENTATION=-